MMRTLRGRSKRLRLLALRSMLQLTWFGQVIDVTVRNGEVFVMLYRAKPPVIQGVDKNGKKLSWSVFESVGLLNNIRWLWYVIRYREK